MPLRAMRGVMFRERCHRRRWSQSYPLSPWSLAGRRRRPAAVAEGRDAAHERFEPLAVVGVRPRRSR